MLGKVIRFCIPAAFSLLAAGCRYPPKDPVTTQQTQAQAQRNGPVAIVNVTVVDVATGEDRPAMTVITEVDRITKIGRGISVPGGAARVDGTGKFLIPGLWDMHTHHQAAGAECLDLFVANGVVGTRDMGSDVDFILPLRDRINRGELLGPEIVAAGPILDDRPLDWPFRRHVTNAQEARDAVRDLKKRGVDFIKVHDGTPRDAYFAIADEAAKLGLPFAGHVPINVTVEEAADSGIASIEHLANFRVFQECSENQPYSLNYCHPLFDKLASNRVWQTPTMAFFQAIPDLLSGKPLPHTEYASDSLLELTRGNAKISKLSDRTLSSWRSAARTSLIAIHDLSTTGSGFLAGSDGLVPGFSIHDELEWLTKAGLSPLQALQTATINPARFLGREKALGSIEVGKRADLVLLEGDPLANIVNTRRITAVLARGHILFRPDLDRMIAAHRRARSDTAGAQRTADPVSN